MIVRALSLFVFLLPLLSRCTTHPSSSFTIAAAANVQFAMEQILQEFENQTGYKAQMVIGSSGKLTAQIKEGAPYDIFISADLKYPTDLFQATLTHHAPKEYASGVLVLWTVNEQISPSLKILPAKSITHVAIANPSTAPYGKAAEEVLRKTNLLDSIKDKLVYGESISQVNQFILSNSAEIGFTAKSIVVSPEMKSKGHWVAIDTALYSPIKQGIVLVKRDNQNMEAMKQFYDFMFSSAAKKILVQNGYNVNP